ncbi:hypothetical protein EV359DRAFT_77241 [Lentinula novae-zelandiae]|nr:hypothetical protein EV359DRAFT_77241 [Lentinula novae-zelandiae]
MVNRLEPFTASGLLPYEVWLRIALFAAPDLHALSLTSTEVTWPAYELLYNHVIITPALLFAAADHWIVGKHRVLRRIRGLEIDDTDQQDCQITDAHFEHRSTLIADWPKFKHLFSLMPALNRLTLSGVVLGPGLPIDLNHLHNLVSLSLRRLCIPSDDDNVWHPLRLPTISHLEMSVVCWHGKNRDMQLSSACPNTFTVGLSWHSGSYAAYHDCLLLPHLHCHNLTISTNYASWPSDDSLSNHRSMFLSLLRSFESLSSLQINGLIPSFPDLSLKGTPLSKTLESYEGSIDMWRCLASISSLHTVIFTDYGLLGHYNAKDSILLSNIHTASVQLFACEELILNRIFACMPKLSTISIHFCDDVNDAVRMLTADFAHVSHCFYSITCSVLFMGA